MEVHSFKSQAYVNLTNNVNTITTGYTAACEYQRSSTDDIVATSCNFQQLTTVEKRIVTILNMHI